jgi:hypothetical protein
MRMRQTASAIRFSRVKRRRSIVLFTLSVLL